jgi:hypothetical protein
MKEVLITFDTAKLAKEKGFDWKTAWRYQGDDHDIVGGALYNHNCLEEQKLWNIKLYSAPTQSFLQKWLREKYNLHIEIILKSSGYKCDGVFMKVKNKKIIMIGNPFSLIEFNSYEEALEIGLQEGLKLIK